MLPPETQRKHSLALSGNVNKNLALFPCFPHRWDVGSRMLAFGVAGAQGDRVMMVDEVTGEERWAVQDQFGRHANTRVAMSPSGRFMAIVGGNEKRWKLWDAASGAEWMAGARHDGTGACICGATRSDFMAPDARCALVAHASAPRAVAFAPCGKRFASGDSHGVVILWDAQTGKLEHRMQMVHEQVHSLCFSADGARLASGHMLGSICLWDATGAFLRRIQEPIGRSYHPTLLHFSPTEGGRLVSRSDDTISVWNVDTGVEDKCFAGTTFAVFSPGGRTIATISAASHRDVLLVDVETGAVRLTLAGHQRPVFAACFSMEGRKLASLSNDGACKMWDSSTGAVLRTMQVVKWPIFSASLSWGRDWVQDRQKDVAFAMGLHARLGAGSEVLGLDEELLRMILDQE